MAEEVAVENIYVKMKINRCDVSGALFDPPKEGAVSISNTIGDIWEVDLKVGPNYVRDNNLQVISLDEAKAKVAAKKGKLRLEL